MDIEKKKEIVNTIFNIMEFYSYPQSFLKMVMAHLQLEDLKVFDKNAAIDKIILVYEQYNQRYQIYLQKTKFKNILSDVKDFIKSVFKRYDEKINYQIKDPYGNRNSTPGMGYEESNKFGFRENPYPNHMNMNMNMNNTFLQIPSMNTQQIQTFQKKMYEVCKSAMPQIIGSLPGNQPNPNIYSNSNLSMFNPFGFSSFSKPEFISNPSDYSRMVSNNMPKYPSQASSFAKIGFPPGNQNTIPANMTNKNFIVEQPRIQNYYQKPQTVSQAFIPQNPLQDQAEKKYSYSQKNISFDPMKKDTLSEFSQLPISQNSFQKLEYQEPRKKVKKDMEYPERDVEKNKVFECTCDGSEEQECNYCELKNIIPFNEVKTIIKVKKIQNFETTPFLCKIDESIFEKYFHDQENYDIEIRCLRMDENYKNQISWPDSCIISINDEQILSIMPLQNNSSLKKRRDKSFLFSKNLEEKQLNFKQKVSVKIFFNDTEKDKGLSNKRIINKSPFIFGAFLVQKHPLNKIYESIKAQVKQIVMADEFKQQLCADEDQITIQKISLSPYDNMTKELMADPVKGVKCRHPQCFDLKTFLSFKRPKQWKCQICNEKIKKFVLNKDLKQIIGDISRMIKQPKQICFYKNEGYHFKYDLQKKKEEIQKNQKEKQEQSEQQE